MTGRRRSPAELAALVGFTAPLPADAGSHRREPVLRVDVEPNRRSDPGAPQGCTPREFDPLAFAGVEVIEAGAGFSEAFDDRVIRQLQRGPGSKLLDLRPAPAIKLGLFDRLTRDWTAPRGTVPRLGILLGFEQWIVLGTVAARRLSTLADRGVTVEIFYPQQRGSLPTWFAGDDVRHDRLRDVIAWLRAEWSPGPIWPTVLHRTARLIEAHAQRDDVPAMLLELAAIARTIPGTEAAEQAAAHARAALSCIGDPPSRDRCRALRALGSATLALNHDEAGLALLETAITTAIVLGDPIEEGRARAEMGLHALRCGRAARAEARFRVALVLVATAAGPADLRARLHHHVALALHMQRKDDDAERHATIALDLRPDPGSQLAHEDRALLALIRARRTSPRN